MDVKAYSLRTGLASLCLLPLLLTNLVTTRGEFLEFYPSEEDKEGLPVILWWDGLGTTKDYITVCQDDIRCFVANNKFTPGDDIMVYAFYASSFLTSGLPFPRKDGDIWAFIHEESPKNSDWLFTFESTLELFNYSATFKRESHYPLPTHWLSSESVITHKDYFVTTEEKNRLRKEGQAPILFVHSDCSTPSNREDYVKMLMEYVNVDSYGSCLHNKEFPDRLKNLSSMDAFQSKEFYKFVGGYKFSIAFENAICDDYITEKLWRPLQVGSVPIVHGSSKVKDFLPSNKSAVVINDFDSVKELAEFIKYLDENDNEYNSYLEFKHTGITNPTLTSEIARMRRNENGEVGFMSASFGFECFLCRKLHEAKAASEAGKPIPKSRATLEHFNCPLPTQKFNDFGQTVSDNSRSQETNFYQENAKLFRNFYDKGENITAERLYHVTRDVIKKKESKLKEEL